MAEKLLEVKHLKKYFDTPRGKLHAVDDVSFSIEKGKTLGVVGESGCGKSTTGRCILRLIEPTSGEVIFNGQDITKLHPRDMKALRKDMQIIFQDPYASLDPRKTISQIISEPIIINKILTNKQDVEDRVHELMDTVGLAQRLVNTYPQPAYRHRPRACHEPQVHRLRRACLCTGRLHSGPDSEPFAGFAGEDGADVHVHHA